MKAKKIELTTEQVLTLMGVCMGENISENHPLAQGLLEAGMLKPNSFYFLNGRFLQKPITLLGISELGKETLKKIIE